MSEHGEHLAALVMTALAVILAFVAVYGWSGVPQHPVASRVLKWVVFFGAAVWGIYSAVVIWRNRGTNPWTHLNWQDVVAIQAYALASWRWLAIAVIALFAFLIGRSTKNPVQTERRVNEATTDQTLSLSDSLACEDASLHELLRADKQSIETRVKVYVITWKPQFGEETLRPYIDFWFGVFNISLTEVIVTSDKNPGAIKFQKEGQENPADFEEPPRLEPDQPIPIQPRSPGLVVVRQWISRDIAKEIQESGDKSHFWFSGLRLMVSGDGIPQKKLDTNHVITKVENYQAYYEPVLCFGYDADSHVSNEIAASQVEIARLQAENAKLNEAIGGKRQQYKTLSQEHEQLKKEFAKKQSENVELTSRLEQRGSAIQSNLSQIGANKTTKIINELVALRDEGNVLLQKAREGFASDIVAKIDAWEGHVSFYLLVELGASDGDYFLSNEDMKVYVASSKPKVTGQFVPNQAILDRIYTRVQRLKKIIADIQAGRTL